MTTWTDRIGGLAPTQGTADARPVRAATSFVGTDSSTHAGVTFDGVDDYLEVGATTGLPTGATGCTLRLTFLGVVGG